MTYINPCQRVGPICECSYHVTGENKHPEFISLSAIAPPLQHNTQPMHTNYLWVVLRHNVGGGLNARDWEGHHRITTLSIHSTVSQANRDVIERTREHVWKVHQYIIPEDLRQFEEQENGELGYVSLSSEHGGLTVVTSEGGDDTCATKHWVVRQAVGDRVLKKETRWPWSWACCGSRSKCQGKNGKNGDGVLEEAKIDDLEKGALETRDSRLSGP